MTDDKKTPAPGTSENPARPASTPNRDRPREPQTIEGQAIANKPDERAAVKPAGLPRTDSGNTTTSRNDDGQGSGPAGATGTVGGGAGQGHPARTDAQATAATRDRSNPPSASTKQPGTTPGDRMPVQERSRISGGFVGATAAGVLGAAIALIGAWGWQSVSSDNSAVAALTARVKANESGLAGLKKAPVPDTAKLEARITALETAAAKLETSYKRVAATGAELGTAVKSSSGLVSGFEKRIAALEKLASKAKTSVRVTADPAIRKPAGAAPATPAGRSRQLQDDGKLPPRLAALESRLQKLEAGIKPSADLTTLKTQVSALSGQFAPLEKRFTDKVKGEIAPISAAMAKSTAAIGSNAKAIEAANKNTSASLQRSSAAANAILARTLVERIGEGKPFGGLIGAMKAMGAGDGHIKLLEPHAEKGVATSHALARTFKALEAKLLIPEKPKDGAPLVDRLKKSAFSLIRVRPIGKTQDTSPGALFTRIAAALDDGRLQNALALYRQLPASGQKAAGSWAKSLQGRLAAEAAARAILSDVLKTLQQQKS